MFILPNKRNLLMSAAILALPASVHAQTAAPPPTQLQEVVVTGSRLVTNGNKAPTPVTVVTADQLQVLAPSGLADALNELPQFQGSGSPARNSYNLPASNQTGNNLDLRNLGPQRVLTLFDGMRLVPTASTGLVDSSLIPQMLVQKVDVVTGGASAAYGSDAVSGVVNFVLDKKFNGLAYQAQGGVSNYGDYGSERVGLAAGRSFMDGKLHVEGSAEYYNNDGIKSIADRPLGNGTTAQLNLLTPNAAAGIGAGGTASNPYVTVPNAQILNLPYGGYLYNPAKPNAGTIFGPGGAQIAPIDGTIIGNTGDCSGCNFNAHDPALITAIPKIEKDQYFGRADYALTKDFNVFVQGLYGHSNAFLNTDGTISRAAPTTAFPIYSGNAYLPANLQTAITAAGGGPFSLSRMSIDMGPNHITQDANSYAGTIGATGNVLSKFKWDVDYTYSRSEQDIDFYNLDNVKLRAAVDAVTNPASGQIVCNVALTNPGLYPGCVPINLFGQGAPSAAAIAYVHGDAIQKSVFDQNVVEGNLRGDLFRDWAGPVSAAVGAAYRTQNYSQTSNSNPATFVAPTGVRGFKGLQYVGGNFGIGGGSENVTEVYVETLVPLLANVPLAKSLDLNGAFRYTDYSTSGGVNTYKVGLTWAPIDDFRFRITQSRDIRAPTLIELYQGITTANNAGIYDPHTGQTINFVQISSGNAQLKPETSDTTTLGGVFEPRFLPGFSTSVDYYKIKVTGAIGTPYTALQLMTICENSGGSSAVCSDIQRPLPFSNHTAANNATSITISPLNVAEIDIAGVDAEVNYHHALLGGQLRLRALANFPTQYQQVAAPGLPAANYLGNMDLTQGLTQTVTGIPKYNATLTAAYSYGPITFTIDEQLLSSMVRSLQYVYADNNKIPAFQYTNLNVAYKTSLLGSSATFFLKVDNLFDKQPPFVYSAQPGDAINTNRSLYDIVGRAFTLGVRGKF
jgi:outer membrane receptor protein involved in Fe transport